MKLDLGITALENIIKDFYNVTHVRSSIYDGNYVKIFSYPKEHTPICQIMHNNKQTNELCKESNLQAFEMCRKQKNPVIYTCHLGLSEVVAPLWDDDIIIGYVLFGQLSCYPPPRYEMLMHTIEQKCKEYQIEIPHSKLQQIVKHINYRSKEQIFSIAKLLEACTYFIMYHQIVQLNRNQFIMRLDKYINLHLSEKITTSDLCNEFLMSRTKLYDTFNDALKMSIGHYIKQRRINCAKELLASTDLTIGEIVDQTGLGE